MRKHFDLDIADTKFTFAREADAIAADGIYIVRTSLAPEVLDDAATVRSHKSLSQAERAFRCIKTVDLQVRPTRLQGIPCARPKIAVWSEPREAEPVVSHA
jgi:hypothetical protein